MKQKIIILKGLPASGKTTWAREYIAKNPNTKRVNKDDLRAMLDNSKWSKDREKFILKIRDIIVCEALREGKNVIVDDTNFHKSHEDRMNKIAIDFGEGYALDGKDYTVEVKVKEFNASLDECLERDAKRDKPVGRKVILDMHNRFLHKETPCKFKFNDDKPTAIIADIDGTLALHTSGRSPYEWNRVGEDSVNVPIADITRAYGLSKRTRVIIMSGRDGVCRKETEEWLLSHMIYFDNLLMREEGDNRKDTIVKKELYEKYVKDNFNVMFVVDDRDCVVRMWRDLGLTCLQANYGDF